MWSSGRDEIARQRNSARIVDRTPRRLGDVGRGLHSDELRRLEEAVEERRDLRPALGARTVVILAPERPHAALELVRVERDPSVVDEAHESGILMRNTLILIGQIRNNEEDQLAPFDAVVEATVQRARPVVLTALAAMLAFIPLTHSVFWGTLAYSLIGGTFAGTLLTLVFLPALYAIWFKIEPMTTGRELAPSIRTARVA